MKSNESTKELLSQTFENGTVEYGIEFGTISNVAETTYGYSSNSGEISVTGGNTNIWIAMDDLSIPSFRLSDLSVYIYPVGHRVAIIGASSTRNFDKSVVSRDRLAILNLSSRTDGLLLYKIKHTEKDYNINNNIDWEIDQLVNPIQSNRENKIVLYFVGVALLLTLVIFFVQIMAFDFSMDNLLSTTFRTLGLGLFVLIGCIYLSSFFAGGTKNSVKQRLRDIALSMGCALSV